MRQTVIMAVANARVFVNGCFIYVYLIGAAGKGW